MVSLVAWSGHAHSSQHHKGKNEVSDMKKEVVGERVGTRKGVPLLCACLTSHKPFASCLKAKKGGAEKERGPQQEESRTCGEKSEVKGVWVWLGPGLVTRC